MDMGELFTSSKVVFEFGDIFRLIPTNSYFSRPIFDSSAPSVETRRPYMAVSISIKIELTSKATRTWRIISEYSSCSSAVICRCTSECVGTRGQRASR